MLVLVVLAIGVALPGYGRGVLLPLEVVLVLLLPPVLILALRDRILRWVWVFGALWGAGQLASNFANSSPLFSNLVLAGPLSALLVSGMFYIHRSLNISAPAIVAAVASGWVVLALASGDLFARGDPWKYGLSTPLSLAILGIAYAARASRNIILMLLVVLSAVSLLTDSRSVLGLFIVGAIATVLGPGRVMRYPRLAVLVLAICGVGLYVIYPIIAGSGALGERALLQQQSYDAEGVNFLLANRPEFVQMATLVPRHLLLGIGSFSPIPSSEAYLALDVINQYVLPLDVNSRAYLLNANEGYLGYNAHSSAMGAILYAGLSAAPFWIFYVGRLVIALGRSVSGGTRYPALVAYAGALGLWDSFFSPLFNQSHIELAVVLFLVCVPSVEPLDVHTSRKAKDHSGPPRIV